MQIKRYLIAACLLLVVRNGVAQGTSTCDTSIACRSIVADTAFNPYVAGVLGNWRNNKSYIYYTRRGESDPSAATNIRTDGTFQNFSSFWNFQDATLQPAYDTSKWVWNGETTLFNRKGLEIENRDPLGRYNAGLFGYNLNLPIAIVQNAHYRESGFDGFEDYGFVTQVCGIACASVRHFDFSAYTARFDTLIRHSGKYSLRLGPGEQAGLEIALTDTQKDTMPEKLSLVYKNGICLGVGNLINAVKVTPAALLPVFSPSIGQRMLVSAWVKENQDCKCVSYTNNRIIINFTGGSSSSVVFHASGGIIEGWQRYEGVFDIPADAVSMSLGLESTGSATVYFDDLRIHPYNANMKSFVYNPVNLRLMAELDDNNYASFYEYDDDGTLVRVKQETQRGIKTIKETRSALVK